MAEQLSRELSSGQLGDGHLNRLDARGLLEYRNEYCWSDLINLQKFGTARFLVARPSVLDAAQSIIGSDKRADRTVSIPSPLEWSYIGSRLVFDKTGKRPGQTQGWGSGETSEWLNMAHTSDLRVVDAAYGGKQTKGGLRHLAFGFPDLPYRDVGFRFIGKLW